MNPFLDGVFEIQEKTPEELAWETKDWDTLDKIIKESRVKESDNFFNVLNSINYDKKELNIDEYCPGYSQYMVNLALSQHIDILPFVEHVNLYGKELTNQMHYDFYRLVVPKKKRFGKWPKATDDHETKFIYHIIQKRYNVGYQTSVRYKSILQSGNVLNSFVADHMFLVEDDKFMQKLCGSKAAANRLRVTLTEKYINQDK